VVGSLVTFQIGDEVVPFRSWDYVGEQYVAYVRSMFEAADPDCGEIVDRGVRGEVEPAVAWLRVASEVQDALISLMHAQSFADHAGISPDVLARPEIAALPWTSYFASPVSGFLADLRSVPSLVTFADTAPIDRAIEEAGARVLHEILEPMGLRTIRTANGGRIVVGHGA
jgi:hypothetical protein